MYWQHFESIVNFHLALGWICVTLGILSGAVMGLCFHRANWLGGYSAEPRRMIRLGHIAFFGMAFLNFSWAVTLWIIDAQGALCILATLGLTAATISMPLICLLSAIKGINRALFSMPVGGTLFLIISALFITLT